ncbi:hypothetical protein ABIF99_009646 [Bradyrhizobium japonicum]
MLLADLAQALEIALRRRQHRGRARHRLDDDGRDRLGAMQGHQTLEIVGELGAMLRLILGEGVAGEVMGVADVVDARQQGREGAAVGDHAADRGAAEADAVIAALAADQAGAARLAVGAVIGERDLQRGVDRLGAGVGEEDAVEALRRDLGQTLGEVECQRMAHLERRSEVQRHQLPLDRGGDLLAAVAGIDAPEAGGAVDHLAAVDGGVVHALSRGEQARRLLELTVGRERHPERVGLDSVRNLMKGHGPRSFADRIAEAREAQQVLFWSPASH